MEKKTPTAENKRGHVNVCSDIKTGEDLFLWAWFNNGIFIITDMNGKKTFDHEEVFTVNGRNFCLIGSQIFETPSGVLEIIEDEKSSEVLEIIPGSEE